MRLDHIRVMVNKLYRKPVSSVLPIERHFLVQQLFMFMRIISFVDIKKVRVMNVKILRDSTLEVFVDRSTMDQKRVSLVFHHNGAKVGSFSLLKALQWYIKSTGLRETSYLFPSL